MTTDNYLDRLRQLRDYLDSSATESVRLMFTEGEAIMPIYTGRQGAYLDAQRELKRLFPELDSQVRNDSKEGKK